MSTINPAAKAALNSLKMEVANEMGVNLKQDYNGNISSKDAGRVGGNMVKKMIRQSEQYMAGNSSSSSSGSSSGSSSSSS